MDQQPPIKRPRMNTEKSFDNLPRDLSYDVHSATSSDSAAIISSIDAVKQRPDPCLTAFHSSAPQDERSDLNNSLSAAQDKNLKNALWKRAEEIATAASSTFAYENLQLQIQRSVVGRDEGGNYNQRKSFESNVVFLGKGDIHFEKIFDQAMNTAKTGAKWGNKTAKSCDAYLNRHGNVVALIGRAGIGKTTLAKRMVQLIVNRQVLPNTSYVFFIQFRDVDFSAKTTLFRFLMSGCHYEHSTKSESISEAKKWIKGLNNPNVVFVFDGLDEANTDHLLKKKTDINRTANAFARQIVTGELFPLSKKLITSRPTQFFELDDACKPHFTVNILGLNQESQNKLGKEICQDKFDAVNKFLHNHPDIAESCFVPANCITIHNFLAAPLNNKDEIAIRSLTDVFVKAICEYVPSDHVYENGEIQKLAGLAWNGFLTGKFIFTTEDFTGIDMKRPLPFFSTTEKKAEVTILKGDDQFWFSILIWQELFASIYVMFVLSEDEFVQYSDKLTNAQWEAVSKFMFGLTHPVVVKRIKAIIPNKFVKNFDFKKDKLHKLAVDEMKRYAAEVKLRSNDITEGLLFQVCAWVKEADNSGLAVEVAKQLPNKITLTTSVSPVDVSCLIYILAKAKKPFSLNAAGVNFHRDSLERLLKGLSTFQVKVNELHLDWNRINNEEANCLVESFLSIKKLHLKGCNLNTLVATTIFNKIVHMEKPMEMLDLAENPIKDEAAASLKDAIHNIKNLRLDKDCLNDLIMKLVFETINSFSQAHGTKTWNTMIPTKVTDEEKNEFTPLDKVIIQRLIDLFQKALKSSDGKYLHYSGAKVAEVLTHLANINKNCTRMLKNKILNSLLTMMMMHGNEEYQLVAVKALWTLALVDGHAPIIESFKKGKFMELLQAFSETPSNNLQEAANRAMVTIKPPDQKLQASNDGHVMISYQWDSQPIMLKVKNELKEAKLKVWMDVDEMRGNLLDRMAEAVEDASVILMCVSQKYKDSSSCGLEASYAQRLQKPIIPISVENNYRGDGWLGLLVGCKLYYDLSNDEKFEENFPKLLKVLSEKKY